MLIGWIFGNGGTMPEYMPSGAVVFSHPMVAVTTSTKQAQNINKFDVFARPSILEHVSEQGSNPIIKLVNVLLCERPRCFAASPAKLSSVQL